MSPEMLSLHPEVEEILQELAHRPGSALLRVPRREVERTLLERQSLASPLTPGLEAAERHLLQAHREELAWALRQAAWVKLCTGEQTRLFVMRRIRADEEVPVPGVQEVRARSSQALRRDLVGGEPRNAIELLERCVAQAGVESWASAAQLAAAAVRLVPADAPRLNAASDLAIRGQHAAAISTLRSVIVAGHAETAVAAYSNLADAMHSSGRAKAALSIAERATRVDPMWVPAHLNLLWGCILAGQDDMAHQASAGLVAALGGADEAARAVRRYFEDWKVAGLMTLSVPEASRVGQTLKRLPIAARSVFDALV